MYGRKPLFVRPADMKITDMCKFVDENFERLIKEPDRELEDTIVKYLFFIIESLAKTLRYFNNSEDYEDFSLFLTSEMFLIMRKRIERAGEVTSNGKVIEPIKSCLNYIKMILYPYKVQYQQGNYSDVLHDVNIADPESLQETMRENVRQQYRPDLTDTIQEIMESLPEKIYYMLEHQSPYRTDPVMIKRIYISCILTFNENITLKKKVEITEEDNAERSVKKMTDAFLRNKQSIILWHLPEHMENYIALLVYKIKRIISNELHLWRNSSDLSDEVVDSIMQTAFVNRENDEGDM